MSALPGPDPTSARRGNAVADALSSWLVTGLGVLSGLVFAPLIQSAAGHEGYGLWRTAFQVIGYYGIFELGIRAAAVRFLAIAWAERDERGIEGALAACASLAVLAVILVVPGSILFADVVIGWFGADPALAHDGVAALRLLALGFGVSAVGGVASFAVHGACRIELANRVELAAFVVRIGLGVYALVEFGTLASLAAANLAASVVAAGGHLFVFSRLYRERPSLREARNGGWFGRVLGFAAKIYAVKLGDVLVTQVALVLVAALLTLELAGTLGYVLALASFVTLAIVNLCDVLYPRLAAVQSDPQRLARDTLAHGQIVSMTAFALLGGFAVLGADFIRIWIAPDTGSGIPLGGLVAIVAATRLGTLATLPTVYALRAVDRIEVYALYNFLEGLLGVALMLVAVRFYGLIGAVASSLVAAVLFRCVALPLYAGRALGVPPRRIVSRLLLQPSLTLLGAVPLWGLLVAAPPDGWPGVALAIAGAAVLLFGTGLTLGISPEARRHLAGHLQQALARTRAAAAARPRTGEN